MQTNILKPIPVFRPSSHEVRAARKPLEVIVVYEDKATRLWAGKVCAGFATRPGEDTVRSTWWRLRDLKEPAVLAGAVSKAIRADVIVVATQDYAVFPLAFHVWVSFWLPHRLRRPGALVVLVPAGVASNPSGNRAAQFEYLRAIAHRARLEFLVEELPPKSGTRAFNRLRAPRAPLVARPRLSLSRAQRYGHG
jgi:hypothetical protein